MSYQSLTHFISVINNLSDKHEVLLETLQHAEALSHVATGNDLSNSNEKIITNYAAALHSLLVSAVDNCETLTQKLFDARKNIFCEISAAKETVKNCHFVLSNDDAALLTDTIKQRLNQFNLHDDKEKTDSKEILTALNTIVGLGHAAVISSNSPHNELLGQYYLYQEHLNLFLQARDAFEYQGSASEIIANCITIMIDIAAASFSCAGQQYFDAFRNAFLILLGELHQNNEKISKIVKVITLR